MNNVIQHPDSGHKRPLGVTLLALLMFLVGGLWLLAAVALPLLGGLLAPWYIHLAAAAYFLVVGWGLWRIRRWAYFTALLMCVVLAFYQLRTAIFFDQNVLVPLLLLILIFGYLLLPRVRVVFLMKDEPRGSKIEDRG